VCPAAPLTTEQNKAELLFKKYT